MVGGAKLVCHLPLVAGLMVDIYIYIHMIYRIVANRGYNHLKITGGHHFVDIYDPNYDKVITKTP